MVDHQLTGLSVADTASPVQTYEQLGGTGTVFNKALAIPRHLGYPWHSLEYVVISPVMDGQESSVGEHLQHTDEIYYIQRGTGVLTTNGISCDVAPGFLAIAPRGTLHGIRNTSSREELALLVVELMPARDDYLTRESNQYRWLSTNALGSSLDIRGDLERRAGGNVSWNSAHMSRDCTAAGLVATGGAGKFYCFATY